MKKIIVNALVGLALSGAVTAKESAIDVLFSTMDMEKQLSGGFEAMLPVIENMARNLKLDEAGKAELTNIYRAWFEQDIDRGLVLSKIKDIYTKTFTEQEIKDITEFYRSASGQKFLNHSPELMKLGAQIGMVEAQAKQTQLLNRLKPFLEKHNIK